MFRSFIELGKAIRMEVEISRQSLDYSGYGMVAVVADNSHVVLLVVAGRAPKGRAAISLNTSHATRHRAERNANMLNDPNEMDIEQVP